jgi:FixJ family two-component response regulator
MTEKTPVIVLTGQSNAAMKRQMLAMGVTAFLMKPLVFDDLLKQLEKHLVLAPGHSKGHKHTAVGS